jgi:hypothetical protein
VVKGILKQRPEHAEALFLSAANWYHLEDRLKTLFFAEQLIRMQPSYSPELYKMKAVCHFKALEFPKSLANVPRPSCSWSAATSCSPTSPKATNSRARSSCG